ncbi:beta-glucuronosyltransferase GlcAT14B-like [Impatiens glandulifera]|uniref:beta-glucuronosyltransferase GlcAT14B-like n=1 Tax=Impatiens glandulifera TaxID=253017 RepID=UPI001FB148C3|nr:beta-glucuronosyltransferase GlcAT14B-like [Impatiens glandulifera]
MVKITPSLLFPVLSFSIISLFFFLIPSSSPNSLRRRRHHFSLPSSTLPANLYPPPPRIAYFIYGSVKEGPRIFRLLQASYHPRNFYLLHLDNHASKEEREWLARMVGSIGVFVEAENVFVMGRGNPVREEGSTPLALLLQAAAILLKTCTDWDWFVNLHASDYPLITQDDFLHIMSSVPRNLNFIEHTSNISSSDQQRILEVIVDPDIYLAKGRMFVGNKKRDPPTAYKIFTGSPHMILSRQLIEFSILGWDNLPRKLLLFFTNIQHPGRDYFQTLSCNSKEFFRTVVNSNLQFEELGEPQSVSLSDLDKMLLSGAAFARKFSANEHVLDAIDSRVLRRRHRSVSPGGWCVGKPGWLGGDPCEVWGDMNILRPGLGSKAFERLLLGTLKLDRCVHQSALS